MGLALCPSVSLTAALWIESGAGPILFALHFEQSRLSIPVVLLCVTQVNGYSVHWRCFHAHESVFILWLEWLCGLDLKRQGAFPFWLVQDCLGIKEHDTFWSAWNMLIQAYGASLHQVEWRTGHGAFLPWIAAAPDSRWAGGKWYCFWCMEVPSSFGSPVPQSICPWLYMRSRGNRPRDCYYTRFTEEKTQADFL